MTVVQSLTVRQSGRVFVVRDLQPGDEVLTSGIRQWMWWVILHPQLLRAADRDAAIAWRQRLATAARIVTEGFWTKPDLDAFLERFARAVDKLS